MCKVFRTVSAWPDVIYCKDFFGRRVSAMRKVDWRGVAARPVDFDESRGRLCYCFTS